MSNRPWMSIVEVELRNSNKTKISKFDEKFREMFLSTISKGSETTTNTNLHRNMYEFQERVFLELKDTQ